MKTLTWQKPGQQNVAQELIKIIINYVAELRIKKIIYHGIFIFYHTELKQIKRKSGATEAYAHYILRRIRLNSAG